jgi:protease I
MKRVAVIIAPEGFQDTEFGIPYEMFVNAGLITHVYSTKQGTAHGKLGVIYDVKYTLDSLDYKRYDALVFVGGPGTPMVRDFEGIYPILRDANKDGKIIAAICWSPTILAKAGILKDKKATVWNGHDPEFKVKTSEYLTQKGAKFTGEEITVDGNIITANGPLVAERYGKTILKKLSEI